MKLINLGDKEKWLEERTKGIGASEASAIMGINPWKSAEALFLEKTGVEKQDDPGEPARWGTLLEPVIRGEFVARSGLEVAYPGPYFIAISDSDPFIRASLDGVEMAADKAVGVVEIKAVRGDKLSEWQVEPPTYYLCQVQHQMAVTGYDHAHLVALVGGQRLIWHRVERHQKFIDLMLEKERDFWRRVQERKWGTWDDERNLSKWLKKQTDVVPGKSVYLDPKFTELHNRRIQISARVKELENEVLRIDNSIKMAIGDSEEGELPDGTIYRYALVKRKGYTVKESASRVLRVVKGTSDDDHAE